MDYLLRTEFDRDWLLIVLTGLMVMIAALRYWFPKRMKELLLLPINDKYFALEGRQRAMAHPFNILMFLIQIMGFGLLIALIIDANHRGTGMLSIGLFVKSILVFGIYMILRYTLDWCLGYFLNCQNILSSYRYQRLSFQHLMALILLLVLSVAFFGRLNMAVVLPLTTSAVIFGLCATIIYSIRRNSSLLGRQFFYFILYLCALEIAPYALLYQAAMA